MTVFVAETHLPVILIIVGCRKALLRLLECVFGITPAKAGKINENGETDSPKSGEKTSVNKDFLLPFLFEWVDVIVAHEVLLSRSTDCLLVISPIVDVRHSDDASKRLVNCQQQSYEERFHYKP